MRDFSWNYFSMTGDVDAYMLYKKASMDESIESDQLEDEPLDQQALEEFD